jgi:hypothetical protein
VKSGSSIASKRPHVRYPAGIQQEDKKSTPYRNWTISHKPRQNPMQDDSRMFTNISRCSRDLVQQDNIDSMQNEPEILFTPFTTSTCACYYFSRSSNLLFGNFLKIYFQAFHSSLYSRKHCSPISSHGIYFHVLERCCSSSLQESTYTLRLYLRTRNISAFNSFSLTLLVRIFSFTGMQSFLADVVVALRF